MRDIKFRVWDKEKMNVRKGSKGMYKQNGYVLAKAEYHPYANKRGYVPLHRLIIENQLGRYLLPRKELVHHIDGVRENNEINNLKLTTPQRHYIEEHFEKRNPNGRFVAKDPIFQEISYRLFDRDKNITQIYTLKELMSKTFRRAKFEFRGRNTGLKDVNGRDIYEGDLYSYIVTHEFGFGEKQRTFIKTVEFKNGAFYHGDELLSDCIDYDDTFTYVGNIYEHSHLLKV